MQFDGGQGDVEELEDLLPLLKDQRVGEQGGGGGDFPLLHQAVHNPARAQARKLGHLLAGKLQPGAGVVEGGVEVAQLLQHAGQKVRGEDLSGHKPGLDGFRVAVG